MHYGQGPGLSNRQIGQRGGAEEHVLQSAEIPAHTHPVPVTAQVGNQASPVGAVPATANDGESNYSNTGEELSSVSTGSAGSSRAHNNMPPFLTINFSISLVGVFPPRN